MTERVCVELWDYREVEANLRVSGRSCVFDAIVSVEMLEHVGERYWPVYFTALDRLLAPDGLIALQTSTMSHHAMIATRHKHTWLHKYVFPGFLVPSITAIERCLRQHTNVRIMERYCIGRHYVDTIRLWRQRFNENARQMPRPGLDETFIRTWNFYLAYCESGFRSGYLDVEQILLSHE